MADCKAFFDKWYCENGLPPEILSDHDKLFMSRFWMALHKLTGVKLKMLTSYHLETESSSEQTNKTVIQCICYAVECDQVGWVRALPKIRFDIMSITNQSTAFTPFQLCFGHSLRLLPPLFPAMDVTLADKLARDLLSRMQTMVHNIQDNLILAKVSQAFQANKSRCLSFPFKVSDHVVLSMAHCRHELRAGDPNPVAKFMPHFDGLFLIKILTRNTLQLPLICQTSLVFILYYTHWKFKPSGRTMMHYFPPEHSFCQN